MDNIMRFFALLTVLCFYFLPKQALHASDEKVSDEVEYAIAFAIPDQIIENHIHPVEEAIHHYFGIEPDTSNIPYISIYELQTKKERLPELIKKVEEILATPNIKALFSKPIYLHMNIPFIVGGFENSETIELQLTDRKVIPLLSDLHRAISLGLASFRSQALMRIQKAYNSLPRLKQKSVRQIGMVGGIFYTPTLVFFHNTNNKLHRTQIEQASKEFTKRTPPTRFIVPADRVIIGELSNGIMNKIVHQFDLKA